MSESGKAMSINRLARARLVRQKRKGRKLRNLKGKGIPDHLCIKKFVIVKAQLDSLKSREVAWEHVTIVRLTKRLTNETTKVHFDTELLNYSTSYEVFEHRHFFPSISEQKILACA